MSARLKIKIHLQIATATSPIPSLKALQTWLTATLKHLPKQPATIFKNLTVRLVDEAESAHLNETFRHKNGPTNVLSFLEQEIPGFVPTSLGDLAICAPLVLKEADEQNKPIIAHWAHLFIHGTLHLLGYDHIKKKEASIMENLEGTILESLGFENPY
jgi:probable rRNA maturation factor